MGAHRFRVLDGWRGLCALGVALFHFQTNGHIAALALVRNAWLFVDFFFVLSGFVIAHAYAQKLSSGPELKTFTLRRFARLWPLHAAMLAALVGLELYRFAVTGTGFAAERSVFSIFTNLALIQSLGVHDRLTWNTPAWSISTEFYTYLVFAGVCAVSGSTRMRTLLCGLAALIGIGVLLVFSRYGMRETFDWGFFRCLYGFFLGALTYDVWKRGWLTKVRGSVLEIVALACAAAYMIFVPGHHAFEYFAPPLFAGLVWLFAGESGVISRFMAQPVVGALGRWSYSIYMVHMLVIVLIFSALDTLGLHWTALLPNGSESVVLQSPWEADVLMLAYLAVVTAFAALTWRFLEMPGQRLFGAARSPAARASIVSDNIPL